MATFQDKSAGLQFEFSENWSDVVQFDEHSDVKKHAKGLSCIDFAGVFSGKKLVLIEVKNFKNRRVEEHQSIFERLGSRNGSPLAEEVAENMKDFVVFVAFLSQMAKMENEEIWEQMKNHLFTCELSCVLWLEADIHYEGIPKGRIFTAKATLEDFLQKQLRWLTEARNVFVVSQLNHHFGEHLQVSFL